jgi:hypothetical protein
MECWASILAFAFGTTMTAELSAPLAGRILPPSKIPWHSFLLEAEWTPRLLNATRRIKQLEVFQGLRRESKTGPPVLWRSASTNCAKYMQNKKKKSDDTRFLQPYFVIKLHCKKKKTLIFYIPHLRKQVLWQDSNTGSLENITLQSQLCCTASVSVYIFKALVRFVMVLVEFGGSSAECISVLVYSSKLLMRTAGYIGLKATGLSCDRC